MGIKLAQGLQEKGSTFAYEPTSNMVFPVVTQEQAKALSKVALFEKWLDNPDGAIEGVPGETVNLFPEAVNRIAAGYVRFLSERVGKAPKELRIAVGHDSRITAPKMKKAVIESLTGLGVRTFDCGLASTPAMFMSIVFPDTAMDGAIMLTASHLPFNRLRR